MLKVSQVVEELKTKRPTRVRVYLTDGEHRDLSPTHKAGRYDSLASMIAGLPWERCEEYRAGVRDGQTVEELVGAFSSDGIGPAEAATAAGGDGDDDPPAGIATTPDDSPEGKNTARILAAVKLGMVESRKLYAPLLDGYGTIVELALVRLGNAEKRIDSVLELAHAAAVTLQRAKGDAPAATPEDDENDSIEKLIVGTLIKEAGPAVVNAIKSRMGIAGEAATSGNGDLDIGALLKTIDKDKVDAALAKIGFKLTPTGGGGGS